jgi:hypothetical protein
MKQLIPLKQFLLVVFITSATILNTGCRKEYIPALTSDLDSKPASEQLNQLTAQTGASASIQGRLYLDLTKDPVIPGGITTVMQQGYLNQGYVLQTLSADKFARHVGFKSSNGTMYYLDGWLKKGTKYLIRKNLEPYILMACGNPEMDFWPDVE